MIQETHIYFLVRMIQETPMSIHHVPRLQSKIQATPTSFLVLIDRIVLVDPLHPLVLVVLTIQETRISFLVLMIQETCISFLVQMIQETPTFILVRTSQEISIFSLDLIVLVLVDLTLFCLLHPKSENRRMLMSILVPIKDKPCFRLFLSRQNNREIVAMKSQIVAVKKLEVVMKQIVMIVLMAVGAVMKPRANLRMNLHPAKHCPTRNILTTFHHNLNCIPSQALKIGLPLKSQNRPG
jgi:hypothetical protein